MANISILTRVIAGVVRQVDLSSNTLVVDTLKVGGGAGTDLTKTILDRLIPLQNGTDVDNTYHTHDGRYYTETELGSTTGGSSGATKIGVSGTPTNYTAASAHVQAHLEGIDSVLGTASSALDGTFRIKNTTDQTKQIAFDASAIATGTVRTITMPNANVNLADVNNAILKDGTRAFTANQPMGGFKFTGLGAGSGAGDSVRYEQAILITGVNAFAANQSFGGFQATNLADPTSSQDAVTLAYLNARIAGIKPKQSVRVATTVAGTLATDFANTSIVDGVTLATGDRILIKDQAAPAENGIYTVNATGAPTRATDFDSVTPIDEINGAWVAVQEGTASAGKIFVQFGTVTTVGTDAINFEYWNPIAGLIGGDMITFAGSTFSVDVATTSGLESTNPGNVAGQLRIKLEASNPTLRFTGSNELALKMDAAGALASGASGVAVQVDNSTIEINTNALRIKDGGVTLAKLASNSVDENKIVSSTISTTGALDGGSGTKISVRVDDSSVYKNGSNNLAIKNTAYDQVTITGGSGTAASVQHAPLMKKTLVAGEAFAANTSFLVRWGMDALTETADRVYKADKDASTNDKFWVIGIALSTSAVSAGQNIDVIVLGTHTLGSSDVAFNASDVGKPVWLQASGAFSVTAPTTLGDASFKAGIVESTTKIWIDRQMMAV